MRKKGSLNLSVNAIVVLILAITMLGLGLGFMKGMFGKVSGKIDAAIDSADLKNPPSLDDPLTLSTKTITVNRGGSAEVQVAFMNTLDTEPDVLLEVVCTPDTFVAQYAAIQNIAGAVEFQYRKAKTNDVISWNVFMNIAKTASAGTARCTAMVSDVAAAYTATLTTPADLPLDYDDADSAETFIKYEDFFVKVP